MSAQAVYGYMTSNAKKKSKRVQLEFGTEAGMVVNSGSRFLERCKQASKTNGSVTDAAPQFETRRLRETNESRVPVRCTIGPASYRLVHEGYGDEMRAGTPKELFSGSNEGGGKRCSEHEEGADGVA